MTIACYGSTYTNGWVITIHVGFDGEGRVCNKDYVEYREVRSLWKLWTPGTECCYTGRPPTTLAATTAR